MMWVIIDGNNWFSRAWFALKPTTSTEPEIVQADLEERSVRAVQTAGHWIQDIKKQLKPTTLAICWDSPNSLRKQLYPEYKSHREKPEGYHAAMAVLRRRLRDYWNVELNGYEADDLLAKFAFDANREEARCLLCSSDKDLHQCLVAGVISQCIGMKRPFGDRRLEFEMITAKLLCKEYGVTPAQWVDYRCMVGDKADGLPGVYGIGPVNASDILVACGTLDGFYAEPFKAPISTTKRNALLEYKSRLPLIRKLITLPLKPETIGSSVTA